MRVLRSSITVCFLVLVCIILCVGPATCFLPPSYSSGSIRSSCSPSLFWSSSHGKIKCRTTPSRTTTTKTTTTPATTRLYSAISKGDKVLVIGGTGGVGQLVTKKLWSKGYDVRVTSRDVERAKETLEKDDDDDIEVVSLDLLQQENEKDLLSAMKDISAVVISVGTTAFPTMKWKGGNTPEAIDNLAVTKIAQAAAAAANTIKRIVLVTSVGVFRTNEMPFLVLNLFGVLDAKRAGEEAVMKAAAAGPSNDSSVLDYVIVRPGRLIGGPYTNLDVAKLLQLEGGTENGVTVFAGDDGLGDCKRDACAEAILQALTNEACSNLDFSIISEEDKAAFTEEEWTEAFVKMKG